MDMRDKYYHEPKHLAGPQGEQWVQIHSEAMLDQPTPQHTLPHVPPAVRSQMALNLETF